MSTDQADRIEATRERLLGRGRAAFGVTGQDKVEPLLAVLRRHQVGLYPVLALGVLACVDGFQNAAVGVLGPDISRALGMSAGSFASVAVLHSAALTFATVAMAHYVGARRLRALVAKTTAFVWSIATLFTAFVRTPAAYAGLSAVDGATSGSVGALHTPLIMDIYPPPVRIRVISIYILLLRCTAIGAPLLVALLAGPFDLTWRGVLLVVGGLSVIGACVGIGLRDPGFGRHDVAKVRAVVADDAAVAPEDDSDADPALSFSEAARKLLSMTTMRVALLASIVGGLTATPFSVYFAFYLADDWGLDAAARGVFGAAVPALSFVLIPLLGRRADRLFSRGPSGVIRMVANLQLLGLACTALSLVSPVFVLVVIGQAVAQSIGLAITPAMSTTMMGVVPARSRVHLIAMLNIAAAVLGGAVGAVAIGGLDQRFGLVPAMLMLLVPSAGALLMLRRVARHIDADLDRTVGEVIEAEEIGARRRAGTALPALSCHGIRFSHGHLRVLDGVDLTVAEGELVALLGTNGAGKSTLLSVVAGLELPQAGTVRLGGADITYLDAERRNSLGVITIRGGDTVFGDLSVAENLRMFARTHRRDRRRVSMAIEAAYSAFPSLARRPEVPAHALSGGEQQMLGLAQALIVPPRLLLVDELSLGLAPKAVEDLLAMVRRINDDGSAVLIVEQSATIALSLADRAYFLERGRVRFEGACDELAAREDLLRSVFLADDHAERTGE